jgi:hypothetical protein
MFVELTVNASGRAVAGWVADTPPLRLDAPLYALNGGDPPGSRRIRLELSTTESLEIEDRGKEIAAALAQGHLDAGRVEFAADELVNFKRHRLGVIIRDIDIDLAGPPIPPPRGGDAPGIEYRRPTIRPRPPVVVGRE